MACHTFYRHSKFIISQSFTTCNRQNVAYAAFVNRNPVFKSYSTTTRYCNVILACNKLGQRKNAFLKCLGSAPFMSTDSGGNQYQVVITNPTQPGASIMDSSVDSSKISEIVKASSSTEIDLTPLAGTSDVLVAEAPDIAMSLSTTLQGVSEIVEPSLSSLGLVHWTPVGLIQACLEYLHISLHMPWWAAIAMSTVIARILLLPVLIRSQKNAINMSNYMPQMQYLQAKFGEARKSGNSIEASRCASELVDYMKKHNISPLKSVMIPLIQAPVFVSFFLGLRAMAKVPVESMRYGGIWWATDLTVPDPFYITPVVSCATMYLVLKVGAESGVKLNNMKMAKYVLQALPVIALPFCINFPAAVTYYWVTTNFCTLAIVGILKFKPIRQYLNMPVQQTIDPQYVMPKKGFMPSMKEAFEDQKVLSTINERRRMDDVLFQKAGTGPIPRTYSYDPTKPRPASAAAAVNRSSVSAKQKESA